MLINDESEVCRKSSSSQFDKHTETKCTQTRKSKKHKEGEKTAHTQEISEKVG